MEQEPGQKQHWQKDLLVVHKDQKSYARELVAACDGIIDRLPKQKES
jgi:hypothetical protein